MSICGLSGNPIFLLLIDDFVAVSYFLMPHRPITEILCSIFKTEINTTVRKWPNLCSRASQIPLWDQLPL